MAVATLERTRRRLLRLLLNRGPILASADHCALRDLERRRHVRAASLQNARGQALLSRAWSITTNGQAWLQGQPAPARAARSTSRTRSRRSVQGTCTLSPTRARNRNGNGHTGAGRHRRRRIDHRHVPPHPAGPRAIDSRREQAGRALALRRRRTPRLGHSNNEEAFMPKNIYLRAGIYWARFKVGGVEYRESLRNAF